MIPYGHQDIDAADEAAVLAVLRGDWLTQGPAIPHFEQAIAGYCGAAHAVVASSATAALHVACRALDLGPGDLLWTSPNTFVASSNCALYCGADVDFVDIDSVTYNLSVPALTEKLEQADRAGRLPKVVMPVHFSGLPCDMAAIAVLSKRYGFRVIEDASHAFGARYNDHVIGSCSHSDITVFSFHPVKIITSGEGGAVVTQDAELARRAALFRSHGITRDPAEMRGGTQGPWYYEQIELGFNYRLTDLQAALGASQLSRTDAFIAARITIADRYDRELQGLPLRIPARCDDSQSAWHLYVVRLEIEQLRGGRRAVVDALRGEGIGVNVHYIPVHLQPYYRALGFRAGQFPEAEAYYERAVSLPMFAALSDADQAVVVATTHNVLERLRA